MMQTLVVIFKGGKAFFGAGHVFGGGVDDVAGEELLPEGEAARGTWGTKNG